MAQAKDVTTGVPAVTQRDYAPQPTNVQTTTTTPGRTDVTTGVKDEVAYQQQTQVASQLNTTPQALAALHSLIASLTERPAISEEELAQKA